MGTNGLKQEPASPPSASAERPGKGETARKKAACAALLLPQRSFPSAMRSCHGGIAQEMSYAVAARRFIARRALVHTATARDARGFT